MSTLLHPKQLLHPPRKRRKEVRRKKKIDYQSIKKKRCKNYIKMIKGKTAFERLTETQMIRGGRTYFEISVCQVNLILQKHKRPKSTFQAGNGKQNVTQSERKEGGSEKGHKIEQKVQRGNRNMWPGINIRNSYGSSNFKGQVRA